MDAVGLTLGNRVPFNKIVINSLQSICSDSFVATQPQKVDFGKVCSYGNITLREKGRVLKVLQCRNSLPEAGSSLEEKYGTGSSVRKKLAVFVSGGGSNFRSIHIASANGLIHGDVVVLVTDKPGCGGAEYARDHNIPVIVFPKLKDSPEGLSPTDLVISLRKWKIQFILLAGFLKLIPIELVQAFPRSIVNIHPSLLPAFGGKGYYGLKVHKAVIASGARYSGPTVHFVDEHYDTGRILAQKVVPVLVNETAEQLAARVLREVCECPSKCDKCHVNRASDYPGSRSCTFYKVSSTMLSYFQYASLGKGSCCQLAQYVSGLLAARSDLGASNSKSKTLSALALEQMVEEAITYTRSCSNGK